MPPHHRCRPAQSQAVIPSTLGSAPMHKMVAGATVLIHFVDFSSGSGQNGNIQTFIIV